MSSATPPPLAPEEHAAETLELATSDGYVPVGDSVRLYYRAVGAGPDTVVVLHGGPGFSTSYLEPDLRPLALSRTLLFYDQRSAGESTLVTDTAKLNWRTYVEDLEALREHFGLETLTLLGHSWGGHLAAQYARKYAENVGRMVFVDAGPPPAHEPYFDPPNPLPRLDSLSLAKLHVAQERWGETADTVNQCWSFYSQAIEGFTSDPAYAHQTWGDVCNAPQATLLNPSRAYPVISLGPAYDFMEDLSQVTASTLILHGEDDLIPVGVADQWSEALPNDQLVIIEAAGHFPQFERPEVFFPVVEAFLEGAWPVAVEEAVKSWPPAPSTAESDYERAWWEITAAHDRLEAAIAGQDASLAAQNYTEDAHLFAPTAPPIRGHRQIQAFFQDIFGKGVRSAEFQTLDLEGDADQLVEGGRYTLRAEDGEVLDMGKYLVVWKHVDGRWKAHRDIFNTTMETLSPEAGGSPGLGLRSAPPLPQPL